MPYEYIGTVTQYEPHTREAVILLANALANDQWLRFIGPQREFEQPVGRL